jgi:hypothetical protein
MLRNARCPSAFVAVGLAATVATGCAWNWDALAPDVAARDAGDEVAPLDGGGDAGDAPVARDAGDAGDAGDARGAGDASDVADVPGANPCSDPGVVFCDGFEDPSAITAVWDGPAVNNGMVQRITAPVHAGGGALEATVGASYSSASVNKRGLPPALTGGFYLRLWFYVPSDVPLVHLLLAAVYSGDSTGISFGIDNGKYILQNPGGVYTAVSTSTVPHDRWLCAVVHVNIGTAGGADATIGTTREVVLSGLDTHTTTGYSWIAVGIVDSSASQGGGHAFIDDVTAGHAPLACP